MAKKKEKPLMTMQEKRQWAHAHERSLSAFITSEFIEKPESQVPYLEFGDDKMTYTDKRRIHVGLAGIDTTDEQDLFYRVFFLIGHELQHCVSTTQRDWEAALNLNLRGACTYIANKVLGRSFRLVKEADYNALLQELQKAGYRMKPKQLMDIIHYICNSLEDGRIEALRAKNHYAFQKYRKYYRGKDWNETDIAVTHKELVEDPSLITPVDELYIILSQVLSLATTGLYQKGFLKAFGDTDMAAKVQGFIPAISKAVIAPTCRKGMKQTMEITEGLYDLILEAAKMSEFEELMSRLAEEIIKSTYTANANNEETGDGIPSESALGKSVLVLELDEDEYEEMKKKAEEAGTDGDGMAVLIKKKVESNDSDEEKQSGASGEDNDPQEKNGDVVESAQDDGESDSSQRDDASKGNDANGKKADLSMFDGTENAFGNNDADGKDADSDSDASDSSESQDHQDGSNSSSTNNHATEKNDLAEAHDGDNSRGDGAEDIEQDVTENVERAMQEAADRPTDEMKFCERDIEKQKEFAGRMESFKNKPAKPMSVDDINGQYTYAVDFSEKTRIYRPTEMLPQALETRGDQLSRSLEKILKHRRKPDERCVRSGRLDGTRLVSLAAFSDIDVFERQGQEDKPDAAMFLLGDNSGSMGSGHDSNRYYCWNAFSIVEHAVSKMIPVKIAAFDADGNNRVMHEVVKDFDEKGPCNFSYNFEVKGRTGWGNKDGYSIRVATKQLLERPEKDKILIIASDGFPTDYKGGFDEGIKDVRSAVESARKAGIKVIGFYMVREQSEEDAEVFAQMYAPDYIVCVLDNLAEELSSVMKKLFKK